MKSSATLPFAGIGKLGVGGGPFGNLFSAITDKDVRETIDLACDCGVRLFDTAPFYGFGLSERRVGDALRGRDNDYLVSTKVGRILTPLDRGAAPQESVFRSPMPLDRGAAPQESVFRSPMPFKASFDYSYDGVMRSMEHSIQRLGLGAIDIALFHDLAEDTHGPAELAHHRRVAFDGGWRAADELKKAGLVKAIGFGLNSIDACRIAVEACGPDCVLLASRYTLLEQTKALPVLDDCLKRNVAVLAGAPFNSGILVQGSRAATTYDHAPSPRHILQRVRTLEAICGAHEVALPAAALQFPLRHPAVCTVVAGFRNPGEMRSAIAWRDQVIPDAFWQDVTRAGEAV